MNALKSYYLSAYLGLGAFLPLLALAMEARGFQPTQYSFLLVLMPLSRLLAPPVWGALADNWLGTGRMLRINTWCSTLAMLALSLPLGFGATLAVFAVYALFSTSLVPLADAGTYRMLGGKIENFGYIRVWGSIGFAVSAAAMGVIGLDEQARTPFLLSAACYVAAGVVAMRFPDAGGPMRSAKLLRAVRGYAKRVDVALLWLASTVYYAAHGVFDVYFGPHVGRLPGLSARVVSSAWAISVVCEVAMLFCMPRLLKSFRASQLLFASALVAALRWVFLAHATTALEVWLLAPAHAVTFGVWYLAFAHENQETAPPELRATVQGLGAAALGLGSITATLGGGVVLERWGGKLLFEVAGVCALVSFALYGLRSWLLARSARVVANALSEP